MTRRVFFLSIIFIMPVAAGECRTPCCRGPMVQVRGSIEKIRIAPGAGMPYIEVRSDKSTERVMLGSMRYLMEQSFNPAAGDEVVVEGVRDGGSMLAVRIEIPARRIRLQLRDHESCAPMWRRHGHHHH